MAPSLWFVCPDTDVPAGGIRVIYRHVEHLVAAGVPAAVVHASPDFRITWFDSAAPTVCADDVDAGSHDLLVVPEIYGPDLWQMGPGVRKVVFNQNAYNSFAGHGVPAASFAYHHPEVVAAVCVSDDNAGYLRHAFPGLDVRRVVNAVDPALFRFRPLDAKAPRIAWMPRKNPTHALQVLNILSARGALEGIEVVALDGLTEAQVGAALSEALVFLSTGFPEGFGLPPAEAMACGCLTIGYHGMGGREFLTPEHAFPVPEGDVVAFARAVEDVLGRWRHAPAPLAGLAAAASAAIRDRYSPEAERRSAVETWSELLLGRPVTSLPTPDPLVA